MNKKILTTSIVILFIGLALAPSLHANISRGSELVEITTDIYGNEEFGRKLHLPDSSLIYIEAPFLNFSLNNTRYYELKDWIDKPFPRVTLMFIGSVVGLRPRMFVRIYVYASVPCPYEIGYFVKVQKPESRLRAG